MVCRLVTGCTAVCALIGGLAGCQEPERHGPSIHRGQSVRYRSGLESEVVSVGSRSSVSGEYAFHTLAKTRIDKKPIKLKLRPDKELKTDGYVVVHINQEFEVDDEPVEYDYHVLLAGDPDKGTYAKGWVKNSAPSFFLSDGSLLIWGRMPFIQTEWVSAGATGSTIAVQIEKDDDGKDKIHRIFYLRESNASGKMWVDCPTGTAQDPVEDVCRYIEVKEGCALQEYCIKDAPKEVREDLQRLTKIAKAAGWNEHCGIDCTTQPCP